MQIFQQRQNESSKPAAHLGDRFIQPMLQIGRPDDEYERDADRVADAVMRMPESQVQMQSLEEEGETLQMKPMEEEEEELQMKPVIQMQEGDNIYASPQITQQISASKGQGSLLSYGLQREMSHKMGNDFSSVKIHTNSKAVQMNRQLGAKAFTHGSDIYFNKGEYNPSSKSGKRLLAHELTHVVQQGKNKRGSILQRQAFLEAGGGYSGAMDRDRKRIEKSDRKAVNILTDREKRVLFFNLMLGYLNPALLPLIGVLRLAGWSINGSAIGIVADATLGKGIGAGGGIEGLLFFDPGDMEVTFDAVPYAQIGIGIGVGAGLDALVGLQLGAIEKAGGDEDYDGLNFSASVKALAGAGVTVSESLFTNREGWVVLSAGIGAEASAQLSLVYAKSSKQGLKELAELIANLIINKIAKSLADITKLIEKTRNVIPNIIAGIYGEALNEMFKSWFIENWDLSGFSKADAEIMENFGYVMYYTLKETMKDWGEQYGRKKMKLPKLGEMEEYFESLTLEQLLNNRFIDSSSMYISYMSAMQNKLMQEHPKRAGESFITKDNFWKTTTHEQFIALAQNWRLFEIKDGGGSFN